jgi:transposase InsO family protein
MCELLNISRSLVYYHYHPKQTDTSIDNLVIRIFNKSRKIYGSRKIQVELAQLGCTLSLRRIRQIMAKYQLISQYSLKKYKKPAYNTNNANVPNIVDRDFKHRRLLEVVISDLTYVRVSDHWAYVCLIIDLFNREIVGFSASKHKDALMVEKAFSTIKKDLNSIEVFHSDRGSEFDNKLIDDILSRYSIKRSLSRKGNPYDNAVAEATYKIFKTEFCFNRKFYSLSQLEIELFDYVNWYNNFRIHSSLGYLSPINYKLLHI